MPRKPPTDALVAHVIATVAYVAHAFQLSLDVDDELDHEDWAVLLDQLDAAGSHLAEVVWLLHPSWREMEERDAQEEALKLFRKHRPDIDESAYGTPAVMTLLHDALDESIAGAIASRAHGAQRRFRDVAAALEDAGDHIEIALYLLDPESYRTALDATTPTQRVKLASRLETLELAIEEHRAMLRYRPTRLGAEMN